MELFISLFLFNVLTFTSNGDICVTTTGNYAFQGNYVELGTDSAGNTYYKEVDVGSCDTNYIFKANGKFYIGPEYDPTTGDYSTYYVRCDTETSTPSECQSFGSVDLTITDGSCAEPVSNTCGSITISGIHSMLDGNYDKTADGLYQRTDNAYYLSFWEMGRYYMLTEAGDVRCAGGGVSSYARFGENQLDGIAVGQELSFTPLYSCCSSTASVACTAPAAAGTGTGSGPGATPAPVAPAPTTPPPSVQPGLGSVCLSTDYTGTLNSGSGITIQLSKLAGEYIEISGGINGRPAYELVNAGSDCGASSTLMYVEDGYNKYMFVRNRNQPGNTYYFSCTNTASITNNDVTQCEFGNVDDKVTLSTGTSQCQCGRTTPAPTTPSPIVPVPLGADSLCFAIYQSTADVSYKYNSVELETIAGQFELDNPSDENNKPVYKLSTSCGTSAYIKYVTNFSLYMLVTDINAPASSYVVWCQNSASITNNDLTQCTWTAGSYFTITATADSCACGQIIPDN